MAWPPTPVDATKAPGAPSSDTEHPDHHNALANAINDTVTQVAAMPGVPVEVEIDFGSSPSWSKTFTISDATVTAGSLILAAPSGNVGTGRVGNDGEWDQLILSALPGSGSFTLTALAVPGPVVGNRKVIYTVAA